MPHRYALKYAKRGWFVFPVAKGKAKPPLFEGWQEKSTKDQEQISQWAKEYPDCNWGLDCGKSGLCVIDVDNKHGKNGDDTYLTLMLDHDLQHTLKVKTPNSGYHLYFEGLTKNITDGSLGPGVDIKSLGGYVVIPGSKRSTGEYRETGFEHPIPILPESLKTAIGQPKPRDPQHSIPLIDLDAPHNIIKATDYLLKQAKPSIQGEHGDDNAYRVACRIRDFGISEDTAIDLLDRYWNQKCDPPWSFEELTKKVLNAYRYSRYKAGSATPEADFEPLPTSNDDPAAESNFRDKNSAIPSPKHISRYQGIPPIREWLVKNWLPIGEISSLYGDGGIGKSLIALQLAFSVATGNPFLGLEISKTMPVLAVMAEDKDDELHRRIHAIHTSLEYDFTNVEDTDLYLWSMAGHSSVLARIDKGSSEKGPFYDHLDSELSKMPKGNKLVILDTLSDIFAGDENNRTSASRFVKVVLHSLINKHDLTMLLLAHPSLTGQNTGTFASGSTAWSNSVRNRLIIKPHDDESLKDKFRILECVKSNYAKTGEALTMYWDNGVYKSILSDDPVFDEIHKVNIDKVFDEIINWASIGRPIGVESRSSNYIGNINIRNHEDKLMPIKTKKDYINTLVIEGKAEIIKNNRKRNGIWPIDKSLLIKHEDPSAAQSEKQDER